MEDLQRINRSHKNHMHYQLLLNCIPSQVWTSVQLIEENGTDVEMMMRHKVSGRDDDWSNEEDDGLSPVVVPRVLCV